MLVFYPVRTSPIVHVKLSELQVYLSYSKNVGIIDILSIYAAI